MKNFLGLALAEASKGTVFLLSVDSASLLRLRVNTLLYKELCSKFRDASNIKIILPGEFVDIIKNYYSIENQSDS